MKKVVNFDELKTNSKKNHIFIRSNRTALGLLINPSCPGPPWPRVAPGGGGGGGGQHSLNSGRVEL